MSCHGIPATLRDLHMYKMGATHQESFSPRISFFYLNYSDSLEVKVLKGVKDSGHYWRKQCGHRTNVCDPEE